jgi:hypothetical protein
MLLLTLALLLLSVMLLLTLAPLVVCVRAQTENPRPEDVECLCKLMGTVGGPLDLSKRIVDKQNNATRCGAAAAGAAGAGGLAASRACLRRFLLSAALCVENKKIKRFFLNKNTNLIIFC